MIILSSACNITYLTRAPLSFRSILKVSSAYFNTASTLQLIKSELIAINLNVPLLHWHTKGFWTKVVILITIQMFPQDFDDFSYPYSNICDMVH